jgi:hypothetical protein
MVNSQQLHHFLFGAKRDALSNKYVIIIVHAPSWSGMAQ